MFFKENYIKIKNLFLINITCLSGRPHILLYSKYILLCKEQQLSKLLQSFFKINMKIKNKLITKYKYFLQILITNTALNIKFLNKLNIHIYI